MARETELYKDKIEVSLDGRQIFYLFFGGAVIVGLVFVLGVMVGRRVEARGHIERAHVEAAVDPLAALDHLEGGNGLSFQGALRGTQSPATTEVEKKIAELAPAEKKKTNRQDAEVAKPEPKPEAKPEKTEKLEKPEKAEKAEKSDKPEKKTKFTLQLSSFKDKDEAQAFLDQMKASGYSASMTKADVDGKQYYRVRMGTYSSVEAANDAKAEFEKSSKKSALVTKL